MKYLSIVVTLLVSGCMLPDLGEPEPVVERVIVYHYEYRPSHYRAWEHKPPVIRYVEPRREITPPRRLERARPLPQRPERARPVPQQRKPPRP